MKRILSLILAMLMALTILPLNIFAVTVIDSGTCGENLTWTLTDDGTLTISGTGDMYDYSYSYAPWYSYRSSLNSVVICDGVTSIGARAFELCNRIKRVSIPSSVTRVNNSAFEKCTRLIYVELPVGITYLGDNVFNYCTRLVDINIPNGVTRIGVDAFFNCESLVDVTLPESITTIDNAFKLCKSLKKIYIFPKMLILSHPQLLQIVRV